MKKNDKTAGTAKALSPSSAVRNALYVDVGEPTFVTVLFKLPLMWLFGCGAFRANDG